MKQLIFLSVAALLLSIHESGAQPPLFHPAPPPVQQHTLESLSCLSWKELECLYRNAPAGQLPCGYFKGRAIYCKGKFLSRARTRLTRLMWRGKHFDCGQILNQWTGVKALKGRVCYSSSWLDGKPSVTLDYRKTSLVWKNVRDEIREVSPGVYVGIMFVERKCERKIRAFFILEADCSRCK